MACACIRPSAAGGGGKIVHIPIITEKITEYPLLESCFLAALNFLVNFFEKFLKIVEKFVEKFCVLGESFFDFLYLYK